MKIMGRVFDLIRGVTIGAVVGITIGTMVASVITERREPLLQTYCREETTVIDHFTHSSAQCPPNTFIDIIEDSYGNTYIVCRCGQRSEDQESPESMQPPVLPIPREQQKGHEDVL